MADETLLDARGHACPMPLLLAHRALRKLEAGRRLRLLSDDAATRADIDAWCDRLGYTLLESASESASETSVDESGHDIFLIGK